MDHDDDDPAAAHYNDSNRAFLQAFMARGTMTFKEAKPVLAAIFTAKEGKYSLPLLFPHPNQSSNLPAGGRVEPEDVSDEDFRSYVDAASKTLSPFDYEIRSALHQISKERIYAIINSTSDPLTQIATIRTSDEIAYIKRLLDAMFEMYNTPRAEIMGVTSMQALKITKPESARSRQSLNVARNGDGSGDDEASQVVDKGITNAQAELLLASLVAEGWFERSKEGWYTLSVRALLELRTWLVATYNDPDAEEGEWQHIKMCAACKQIVTIGQRCSEIDCNVRLHDICQAAFWRTRREKSCPRCKRDWDGRFCVGEKAITTGEAYLRGKRRSGVARRNEVEEDPDPEEDAEGESE
jgi:hypothetical protein